jgi:hypothetical protein
MRHNIDPTRQLFPYSIVYQVQSGQIYLVAVAHASRAAGYWQGRT